MMREGRADASHFGIMDFRGRWFIAGNVVRDVAALNKMEILPWDIWGDMPPIGKDVPDDSLALFDRLAEASRNPDTPLDRLRALYDDVRVPDEVFNSVTGQLERV